MRETNIYEVKTDGILEWMGTCYDGDPEEDIALHREMMPEKNLVYFTKDEKNPWWVFPLVSAAALSMLGWVLYGISALVK